MVYRRRQVGWIEVICGSMFSGKTEELIRRLKRATIARQKLKAFRPNVSGRPCSGTISSRSGVHFEAVEIEHAPEIVELVDPDTDVVAIDEAQFFDWTVADVCNLLADSGQRVIVAGLDMDFRGEPFGPMPLLMAQAERVDKLQAICVVCGVPASRTQRLVGGEPAAYEDPIIMIGADQLYEARCRNCHQIRKKK